MNKKYFIVGAVAMLLLGAACQKKASTTTTTTNSSTNVAAAVEHIDFTIIQKEYSYTPGEFTVGASQTIKVKLTNKGTTDHAMVFSTLDFNSGIVAPGESKVVTFTTPAKAGRYEFHCDQHDHKDKGMIGTMIVQ